MCFNLWGASTNFIVLKDGVIFQDKIETGLFIHVFIYALSFPL